LSVGYKEAILSDSTETDDEFETNLLPYNKIFGMDVSQLILKKMPNTTEFSFSVKSHLIERTTLSKISLFDKVKISVN
jgi:hypothetical protein